MKIEQLDFLDKFDRDSTKQERVVELILQQIPNVKYLRSRIRFSTAYDAQEKEIPIGHVNNILYNLATIAWKRSRWISKYKYEHLTYFLDLTLDARVLNCTEAITREEVQEISASVCERTVAILNGQKLLLKEDGKNVEAIITDFKTLKYLLQ